MSWYVWIHAVAPPNDAGLDAQGRSVVLFNVATLKRKSETVEEEIKGVLVAAGITDRMLLGRKSVVPETGGPYITIIADPGPAPQLTHGVDGASYEAPMVQVRVHAEKYVDARAKARAAYSALTVVKNQDVSAA